MEGLVFRAAWAIEGLESIEELLERVVVTEMGCWIWIGSDSGTTGRGCGYPKLQRQRQGGHFYVHRIVYETFRGPVPERHQVDHLCRRWWPGDSKLVRRCVNPLHLEAVTSSVNQRRKSCVVEETT